MREIISHNNKTYIVRELRPFEVKNYENGFFCFGDIRNVKNNKRKFDEKTKLWLRQDKIVYDLPHDYIFNNVFIEIKSVTLLKKFLYEIKIILPDYEIYDINYTIFIGDVRDYEWNTKHMNLKNLKIILKTLDFNY